MAYFTTENPDGTVSIWYPDGDECGQVRSNLGYGLSAMAVAMVIVNALNGAENLLENTL